MTDERKEHPIRVLVVDDHCVVRAGVRALLGGAAGITVVGEAADGKQAVAEAGRCHPHVILMDLKLPEMDGVEATRRVLAAQPEVGIVVFTSAGAEAEILAAIAAGALGYLPKTSQKEEYAEAIRRAADGEAWLPPHLTQRLLTHLEPHPAIEASDALTGREHGVLCLLARGWSNRRIGQELGISEFTARTHVSHILEKLGLSNRVEAALHALRSGLAPLEIS